MKEWRLKRDALEHMEREIHNHVPKHMQLLVKDKQFLLLEQLASSIGWPDEKIHEEMRNGFRLVGEGTRSNIFKSEVREASLTEMELMKQARFIRPMIIGKVKRAGLPEYGNELTDITRDEAGEKGWLKGPLSDDALANEVGQQWLPVERFAVRQKNKLRPIDNFATNRVNEAWTCPEKLDLHALDQLVWLVSMYYKCAVQKGYIDVKLSDGKELRGQVHADWVKCNGECLLTTLDLKDAYKQMGIHALDRNKAVVVLKSDKHSGVDRYGTPWIVYRLEQHRLFTTSTGWRGCCGP